MAGYLSEKIIKVGPPLVLKRDNGGNVNNGTANEVLSEFFVLHLNSPEYYAPYNGAIEEAQRELKACLREKLISDIPRCQDLIALYAEVTGHDLNHLLRPCLNGRLAARRFFLGEKPAFSKLERRGIYDIMIKRVQKILVSMNQFGKSARHSAWRIVVESWLQSRGFIKVQIPKKVAPYLAPLFCL